jgi:protein-S-isoprenylcysteine O-methyltransferase Ste14
VIQDWLLPSAFLLLYASFHSITASLRFKRFASRVLGPRMACFRLAYVILSILLLLPLYFIPFPGGTFYTASPIVRWCLLAVRITGLSGFIWSLCSIDLREFLGISQILRHRAGLPLPTEMDETTELSTLGAYKYCRHPLYFFLSVALVSQPVITSSYALFAGWCLLYFWIGATFEERRMVRLLGSRYVAYQRTTNRFIPYPQ